jgi:hypothetical protein
VEEHSSRDRMYAILRHNNTQAFVDQEGILDVKHNNKDCLTHLHRRSRMLSRSVGVICGLCPSVGVHVGSCMCDVPLRSGEWNCCFENGFVLCRWRHGNFHKLCYDILR